MISMSSPRPERSPSDSASAQRGVIPNSLASEEPSPGVNGFSGSPDVIPNIVSGKPLLPSPLIAVVLLSVPIIVVSCDSLPFVVATP